MKPLPEDFRDRPAWARAWWNLMVFFHRREIKAVCCESFRLPAKHGTGHGVACKGCATLYDPESEKPLYRFLARVGKKRKV